MKVAADIHERVLELTTALVNTHHVGGTRERWRVYAELRDYCDAVAAAGRDHPFLWESVGDFTTDDRAAIPFYLRALELAVAMQAREHEASIRFALAQRHAQLGERVAAWDYARQADRIAAESDDLGLRAEISQFLLEQSHPNPHPP